MKNSNIKHSNPRANKVHFVCLHGSETKIISTIPDIVISILKLGNVTVFHSNYVRTDWEELENDLL